MAHRKNHTCGGSCIIFGICLSRLGAVFASSGESWNGRAVNAKRLESPAEGSCSAIYMTCSGCFALCKSFAIHAIIARALMIA